MLKDKAAAAVALRHCIALVSGNISSILSDPLLPTLQQRLNGFYRHQCLLQHHTLASQLMPLELNLSASTLSLLTMDISSTSTQTFQMLGNCSRLAFGSCHCCYLAWLSTSRHRMTKETMQAPHMLNRTKHMGCHLFFLFSTMRGWFQNNAQLEPSMTLPTVLAVGPSVNLLDDSHWTDHYFC